MKILILAAAIGTALFASAAEDGTPTKQTFTTWKSPDGAFEAEVPSGWEPGSKNRLFLMGPHGALSVYSYPKDGSYSSPSEFVQETAKHGLKGRISHQAVAGARATRFEREMFHQIDYIGKEKATGSGMQHDIYVVVPNGKDFFVLQYWGDAKDYKSGLPAFEHLVSTFRLKNTGK